MSKRFALINIRDMDFHERDGDPGQRIAQGNAGMGQAARIDDDGIDPFRSRGMDAVEFTHPFVTAQPREGQRPPADTQCDADGRLVGSVSGDIADHDVHGAVRGLHDIEEIAAEQGVLSLPTLQFFQGGRVAKSLSGGKTKNALKKAIDELR